MELGYVSPKPNAKGKNEKGSSKIRRRIEPKETPVKGEKV